MWNFKMGKLRTKPQFGSLKSPSFVIIRAQIVKCNNKHKSNTVGAFNFRECV